MKELTDEQLIERVLSIIGECPGSNEVADSLGNMTRELATRYSALLERLSEVEKERDALKASVDRLNEELHFDTRQHGHQPGEWSV